MAKSPASPEKIRKGVAYAFREAGVKDVTVHAPASNGRSGQPVIVSFTMANGAHGIVKLDDGRVPDKPNLRKRLIEKSLRSATQSPAR